MENSKDFSHVKFKIAGKEMSFKPLPLGTQLVIEKLKEKVKINEPLMKANPLAAILMATERQPDVVRRVVAVYTAEVSVTLEAVKERYDFLKRHCDNADLATLFVCGTLLNDRWLLSVRKSRAGKLSGLDDEALFSKQLVELFKS